jgi:prepilin-type processing-associated H-X9-DG protein
LRQIALAFQQHEDAHRHFPTGGWGWRWHGDPDRGFDQRQPGGWPYAVLPYIEQPALRAAGVGLADPEKRAAGALAAATPIGILHCPSRRRAIAYPFAFAWGYANLDRPKRVARGDYAASLGDDAIALFGPGPLSLREGDSRAYHWTQTTFSGVVFRRSRVRLADISDGSSNVYLAGEKVLRQKDYTNGFAANDDQHLLVGFDRDTIRSCYHRPVGDATDRPDEKAFGGPHPTGCHMAFCDGSVRLFHFAVATETHRRLGNRSDGSPAAVQD